VKPETIKMELEFELIKPGDKHFYGGGFKSTWLEGTDRETGTRVELLSGTGMGNPYLEATAEDTDGNSLLYRVDMRPMARKLWGQMQAMLEAAGGDD
jgi:hypothetical protein